MEENADKRELKRVKLEAEIDEKRREEERKHEERMQTMVMGFMTQMIGVFRGHAPPFPNPHHSGPSYSATTNECPLFTFSHF